MLVTHTHEEVRSNLRQDSEVGEGGPDGQMVRAWHSLDFGGEGELRRE